MISATLEARMTAMVTARARMDTRYSFTPQFLRSSVIFARRCAEIERTDADQPTQIEHRGLATAVVMQCVAAVEAESAEVTIHGPGHQTELIQKVAIFYRLWPN